MILAVAFNARLSRALRSRGSPNRAQMYGERPARASLRPSRIATSAAISGCSTKRNFIGAGNPFFLWVNFTHMHVRTHIKPESRGQAGRWQSEYHDVMIDHDKNVGQVLNGTSLFD